MTAYIDEMERVSAENTNKHWREYRDQRQTLIHYQYAKEHHCGGLNWISIEILSKHPDNASLQQIGKLVLINERRPVLDCKYSLFKQRLYKSLLTDTHTHICTCINTCTHTEQRTQKCFHAHMNTHICTHTHRNILTKVHTHADRNSHTYECTHIHTFTHTFPYRHGHAHAYTCSSSCK